MVNGNAKGSRTKQRAFSGQSPGGQLRDSPIGPLTPGQQALWDGMSESEQELTKYLFHVPGVDMSKIRLGQRKEPERKESPGTYEDGGSLSRTGENVKTTLSASSGTAPSGRGRNPGAVIPEKRTATIWQQYLQETAGEGEGGPDQAEESGGRAVSSPSSPSASGRGRNPGAVIPEKRTATVWQQYLQEAAGEGQSGTDQAEKARRAGYGTGASESAQLREPANGMSGGQAVALSSEEIAKSGARRPGRPDYDLDAAYRELLLQKGREDPRLYSNSAFVRELHMAEERMRHGTAVGQAIGDSYSPERNRRVLIGGALKAAEDIVNLLGYVGKGAASAAYASAAADQWMLGKLTGSEQLSQNGDELMDLSRDTAGSALRPFATFGSRYLRETAARYPYSGPGRKFLDQVLSGTGSMAPSFIANLAVPGSGIYVSMLQSTGSAITEAKQRGADDTTALVYGMSVGIAEAAIEKLGDGLGGLFGKGALDDVLSRSVRQSVSSPVAQEAILYLGGMAGEGLEECLSVFANELIDGYLLGGTVSSWKDLLSEGTWSFLAGAVTAGLVQGAQRLSGLLAGDKPDPAELGRLLAREADDYIRQSNEAPGLPEETSETERVYTSPEKGAAPAGHNPVQSIERSGLDRSSEKSYNKNIPYRHGRPSFRRRLVDRVWDVAVTKSSDGIVRDPNTDEPIIWQKGTPRKGVWDMGHLPDRKYSVYYQKFAEGEMTKKEFLDWYNDYRNYRPELPSNNRSHKYE